MNLHSQIKEKIKNLPSLPGCYLFYNDLQQLIYVGKAKQLNKRVISYFNKVHNYKTTQLVRKITNLEFIITNNEKEALVLEHNLIKKYRPRYNILLNDDKRYPYIEITNEKDPVYRYVRKVKNDGGIYYGPFPDGTGAREVLKILQQLFPLRRCQGNLKKPCLYYHIDLCSGACFKKVDPIYYETMIKKLNRFFKGQIKATVLKINNRMLQASDNMQYEEAQRLKNVLDKLKLFIVKQAVQFKDYINRDFVGYYLVDNQIAINTLFYRNGQLLSKDEEIFTLFNDNLDDCIRNYLQQLYSVNTLPDELYASNAIDLLDWSELIGIKIITKPSKKMLEVLKLANDNAQETWNQTMLNQYQIKYYELEIITELGKKLGISSPYNLEMYDIANINNENVIAGVVVYQNGKPIKELYRRYNIDIDKQGDVNYMKALVYRRFHKKLVSKDNLPDLIIVDGAIQQVNGVIEQLKLFNLTIPVAGIVKNSYHKTDHLINSLGQTITLNKKSRLFNWLTKIQDDVHNYTNSHHRKLRTKSLFTNILDDVPGLGTKSIKKIQEHFDNIQQLKAATFIEINNIIKNKNVTQKLIEILNKKN